MERKALEQKLTGFFEELHMHPELSYEEYETTERIKRELAAAGIEILQIPLKTGVTAIVRGAKPGKTYGLRCDIDALPIAEETDLPYKSKTPGKMHACGHDFHTAAVFGAALLLQERKEELQGTVKILFQPAEESSHGAETVLETGVFSDVTAIFGLHTAAYLPVGTLGIRAGSVMAAVDRFELNITGTGCHGGHPDEGVDTILVAASVIQAFQSIVGRNLNPFHTGVVSVTRINGGNTWNVIPDKVELEGTVRSMEKDACVRLRNTQQRHMAQMRNCCGIRGRLQPSMRKRGVRLHKKWQKRVALRLFHSVIRQVERILLFISKRFRAVLSTWERESVIRTIIQSFMRMRRHLHRQQSILKNCW